MKTSSWRRGRLMLGVLAGIASAQEEASPWPGVWEAQVNGKPVCTIELRGGKPLRGSVQACRLHTDEAGNLVEPEAEDDAGPPVPIGAVEATGRDLRFEYRDKSDETALRMRFTLVREGVADLVMENALVRIRPIRFVRRAAPR